MMIIQQKLYSLAIALVKAGRLQEAAVIRIAAENMNICFQLQGVLFFEVGLPVDALVNMSNDDLITNMPAGGGVINPDNDFVVNQHIKKLFTAKPLLDKYTNLTKKAGDAQPPEEPEAPPVAPGPKTIKVTVKKDNRWTSDNEISAVEASEGAGIDMRNYSIPTITLTPEANEHWIWDFGEGEKLIIRYLESSTTVTKAKRELQFETLHESIEIEPELKPKTQEPDVGEEEPGLEEPSLEDPPPGEPTYLTLGEKANAYNSHTDSSLEERKQFRAEVKRVLTDDAVKMLHYKAGTSFRDIYLRDDNAWRDELWKLREENFEDLNKDKIWQKIDSGVKAVIAKDQRYKDSYLNMVTQTLRENILNRISDLYRDGNVGRLPIQYQYDRERWMNIKTSVMSKPELIAKESYTVTWERTEIENYITGLEEYAEDFNQTQTIYKYYRENPTFEMVTFPKWSNMTLNANSHWDGVTFKILEGNQTGEFTIDQLKTMNITSNIKIMPRLTSFEDAHRVIRFDGGKYFDIVTHDGQTVPFVEYKVIESIEDKGRGANLSTINVPTYKAKPEYARYVSIQRVPQWITYNKPGTSVYNANDITSISEVRAMVIFKPFPYWSERSINIGPYGDGFTINSNINHIYNMDGSSSDEMGTYDGSSINLPTSADVNITDTNKEWRSGRFIITTDDSKYTNLLEELTIKNTIFDLGVSLIPRLEEKGEIMIWN